MYPPYVPSFSSLCSIGVSDVWLCFFLKRDKSDVRLTGPFKARGLANYLKASTENTKKKEVHTTENSSEAFLLLSIQKSLKLTLSNSFLLDAQLLDR